MAAKAILGISLGTRHAGIAVVYDGRLVHWKVHTFTGVWSDIKLQHIIDTFKGYLQEYGPLRIVVKIPDIFPTSKAFSQVVGCLNVLAERNRTRVRYFTLQQLKVAYAGSKKIPMKVLIERIVKRHSELLPEYRKEKRNKEGYYYKLFEAVLCTEV